MIVAIVLLLTLITKSVISKRPTFTTGTITHYQTTFQVTMNTRRPISLALDTVTISEVPTALIPSTTTVILTETIPFAFVGEVTTVNGQECQVSRLVRTRTVYTSTVTRFMPTVPIEDDKQLKEFDAVWSLLNARVRNKGTTFMFYCNTT